MKLESQIIESLFLNRGAQSPTTYNTSVNQMRYTVNLNFALFFETWPRLAPKLLLLAGQGYSIGKGYSVV